MSTLILDQAAVDKLRTTEVGVEVRDQQGTLVGFFQPAFHPDEVDQFECPVDETELKRRAAAGGGRPLADILCDLEQAT